MEAPKESGVARLPHGTAAGPEWLFANPAFSVGGEDLDLLPGDEEAETEDDPPLMMPADASSLLANLDLLGSSDAVEPLDQDMILVAGAAAVRTSIAQQCRAEAEDDPALLMPNDTCILLGELNLLPEPDGDDGEVFAEDDPVDPLLHLVVWAGAATVIKSLAASH